MLAWGRIPTGATCNGVQHLFVDVKKICIFTGTQTWVSEIPLQCSDHNEENASQVMGIILVDPILLPVCVLIINMLLL